jgi:hypothetical protein
MPAAATKRKKSIDRKEFVRFWMQECGVTYDVASQVYQTMVGLFEKAVANGQRINIGRLGALVPHWQDTREVVMPFRRVRNGVLRQKQTYILDPRIRYKFKIYKEWMATRHLTWYEG